jgi:hypothetical protein
MKQLTLLHGVQDLGLPSSLVLALQLQLSDPEVELIASSSSMDVAILSAKAAMSSSIRLLVKRPYPAVQLGDPSIPSNPRLEGRAEQLGSSQL